MYVRARALLALLAFALLGAGSENDAIGEMHLRIDLERLELRAIDPRRPDDVMAVPVVTGSPAHPTPVGRFQPRLIVRNPGWKPGPTARARGARPMAPSGNTPMGVAKMPLSADGFSLHGGAVPLLLGKPASLGCVRMSDEDMLALIAWLDRGGILGKPFRTPEGEIRQWLDRRLAVLVR
jgi:hypothetical protein